MSQNLYASVEFYSDILRGNVDLTLLERSALCAWNKFTRRESNMERTELYSNDFLEVDSRARSTSWTVDPNYWINIELVEFPATQSIDIRASQGLFIIKSMTKNVLQNWKLRHSS